MIDLVEPRMSDVGGVTVARLLPRAVRRTIGAWCFVDHAGPVDVDVASMQVGPHPHIGLHTVSWMLAGELVHRDSLGSEQVLRPGQLNLMTAGHGIAHAEQVPSRARGEQHLLQLWVAQPESTRHGPPEFAHHADLPVVDVDGTTATVLVGALAGARSPARADTPLLGADLVVGTPTEVPVEPTFEHGILAVDRDLAVADGVVPAGTLGYLPPGADRIAVRPAGSDPVRALLLGGEPFPERIRMHWNFVARDDDELRRAVDEWNGGDDRFGPVGGGLARIPSPPVAPGRR